GSGSDLKSVQRKDFPGVRMDDILALLERDDMGDTEMVSYLAHGLLDSGGTRPSIETLLHGFLPSHAVIHTHADAIVSLTNNDHHRDVFAEVYGKDVITLPYRRPGFRISRYVADTLPAASAPFRSAPRRRSSGCCPPAPGRCPHSSAPPLPTTRSTRSGYRASSRSRAERRANPSWPRSRGPSSASSPTTPATSTRI